MKTYYDIFRLPSLFMPASRHLRSRQARHWFLCVLSTRHAPSPFALHTYCLFRRIDLCNKHTNIWKSYFIKDTHVGRDGGGLSSLVKTNTYTEVIIIANLIKYIQLPYLHQSCLAMSCQTVGIVYGGYVYSLSAGLGVVCGRLTA